MMRLGHEMRRRISDRTPLRKALHDAAVRMDAVAAMLWMPYSHLKVAVAGDDGAISVPVGTEFDSIAARIATLGDSGQPAIFQGDDNRIERRAACRLLIAPVETGVSRYPAWLVFARELSAAPFNTWSAGTGAGAEPAAVTAPAARIRFRHRAPFTPWPAHGARGSFGSWRGDSRGPGRHAAAEPYAWRCRWRMTSSGRSAACWSRRRCRRVRWWRAWMAPNSPCWFPMRMTMGPPGLRSTCSPRWPRCRSRTRRTSRVLPSAAASPSTIWPASPSTSAALRRHRAAACQGAGSLAHRGASEQRCQRDRRYDDNFAVTSCAMRCATASLNFMRSPSCRCVIASIHPVSSCCCGDVIPGMSPTTPGACWPWRSVITCCPWSTAM